jgi:uncharacterized protein YpiB (UPF0302 family)
MKQYKIKEETCIAILNYLAEKPFKEVNELIKLIQAIEPITEEGDK